MQIIKAEVTPVELELRQPIQMVGVPVIKSVTAIFIRLETQDGRNAWGCGIAHPELNQQEPEEVTAACLKAANIVPDLHPIDIEYSLSKISPILRNTPAGRCAYDLAFHDLLGLAAGMPLYRLLGGYRRKIQTSVTIPIGTLEESLGIAQMKADNGFRMLKIKGGVDPEEDIHRILAIHRALPGMVLRLDADGGYTVQDALDVARRLDKKLEMLEQPTGADDLGGLFQVTHNSSVPVLADQSISGPRSALELAAHNYADGFSIKLGACGGITCGRQMDGIARALGLVMMVSCLIEPALLIAAGLSFALSSPGVEYADLDGNLDLINDPTVPGFKLEDGWLIATDIPGLGCTVDL